MCSLLAFCLPVPRLGAGPGVPGPAQETGSSFGHSLPGPCLHAPAGSLPRQPNPAGQASPFACGPTHPGPGEREKTGCPYLVVLGPILGPRLTTGACPPPVTSKSWCSWPQVFCECAALSWRPGRPWRAPFWPGKFPGRGFPFPPCVLRVSPSETPEGWQGPCIPRYTRSLALVV